MRLHDFFQVWAAAMLILSAACNKGKHASNDLLPEGDQIWAMTELSAGMQAADHAILPAPGNLGFIIGTDASEGRALSCLVVGAALPARTRVEVLPVAAVQWRTGDEWQTCIVATPMKEGRVPPGMEDFMAFRMAHDDVRAILERWFQHHYIRPDAEWLGWQNEVYARAEIDRARQR